MGLTAIVARGYWNGLLVTSWAVQPNGVFGFADGEGPRTFYDQLSSAFVRAQ